MIRTYEFHSECAGPHLIVLGAVHGNETCGTRAIEAFVEDISVGRHSLKCGGVTFVPVCNPRACEMGTRCVDEDLNRVMRLTTRPDSYEQRLANVLCRIVKRGDAMIDLHSMTSPGEPFALSISLRSCYAKIFESVGVRSVVTGRGTSHRRSGQSKFDTTTRWAASLDIPAITLECGENGTLEAELAAYRAIGGFLGGHGLIDANVGSSKVEILRAVRTYIRHDGDQRLICPLENLASVKCGDPLILRKDGSKISAPFDARVLMPTPRGAVGKGWLDLVK